MNEMKKVDLLEGLIKVIICIGKETALCKGFNFPKLPAWDVHDLHKFKLISLGLGMSKLFF